MNISIRVVCVAALLALGAELCFAADEGEDEKKAVWSTIKMQVYGYIKLDAAYDTGQAVPGNYVKWIDLDPLNPHDSQFNMTANETRLGLRLKGPADEHGNLETTGTVEIDFYGGGAENKPRPMLRHAYVDLHWRQSNWRFLAGQTGDVISPLYPKTLDYPVAWWAGNIGYRRPQLRLTKTLPLTESSSVVVSGALTRDIGSTASTFTGVDSGTDAGMPGIQARVGWQLRSRSAGPASFGLSGHWAKEHFQINDEGDHLDFDSWSGNFDFRLPLTAHVTFMAEVYTGVNLAQYLGGIGQGVNLETNEEIGDTGGWISLDLGPFHNLTHHVGLTASDPDDDNLVLGDRSFNSSIFWNGFYELNRHVHFALELSYWNTEYLVAETDPDSADNFRVQFAVFYRF